MRSRASILRLLGWAVALIVMLLPTSLAFAQSDDSGGGAAAGGLLAILAGFMLFIWVFILAIYIYVALALQTIAKKTNTENAWWAWIPILNVVLALNIIKKPVWWVVLCIIPLVQIVMFVIIWMGLAEARNKPSWWGILIIIPVVNLIVPGYLAWAD